MCSTYTELLGIKTWLRYVTSRYQSNGHSTYSKVKYLCFVKFEALMAKRKHALGMFSGNQLYHSLPKTIVSGTCSLSFIGLWGVSMQSLCVSAFMMEPEQVSKTFAFP